MLKLHDFILLKAVFNQSLHNAILSKDKQQITLIINSDYAYELENGFIRQTMEPIDMDHLYNEHKHQLENDSFDWAL